MFMFQYVLFIDNCHLWSKGWGRKKIFFDIIKNSKDFKKSKYYFPHWHMEWIIWNSIKIKFLQFKMNIQEIIDQKQGKQYLFYIYLIKDYIFNDIYLFQK